MKLDGYLKPDENVVMKSKTSKTAILFDWLSLPCLMLIFFLTVIVPVAVKTYASEELKSIITEAAGLEEIGLGDLLSNPLRTLFPEISNVVRVLLIVIVVILVAIWFIFCCIRTKLICGYEIIVTEKRIIAYIKGEVFTEDWQNIKNVYIERSLFGRLLNYGTVTVNALNRTVSVKHVSSPITVRNEFYLRCGQNFY